MPRLEGARRPSISAIITTFNEERCIGRCIESLLWCDELIVVDSYSTDRTVEICKSYEQTRLVQHIYYGAAAQKNWAMKLASHDWLLIFDADEVCTPQLRREIEDLLSRPTEHAAFTIRRRVFFLGKAIRYSGWRNDRVVRLMRAGAGRFENKRVHPRWEGAPAPILRQSMDHYMVEELDPFVKRLAKYGYWGAAQERRNGTRSNLWQIMIHTFYRFFRTYVMQLGILDGTRGLVFCLLQAHQTHVKWSLLWAWRVNAARGVLPKLPPFEDDPEETARSREVVDSRPCSGVR